MNKKDFMKNWNDIRKKYMNDVKMLTNQKILLIDEFQKKTKKKKRR